MVAITKIIGSSDGQPVLASTAGVLTANSPLAGSKVTPDFGAQNVITTGTITGASFSPTGTAVPVAGLFRPATNVLAWSTNSLERLRIDSSGNVLIGNTNGTERLTVTGNAQANAFIPSSSTVPTNGLFLPATNVVGIATDSLERLRVSAGGALLVGSTAQPAGDPTGTVVAANRIIISPSNYGRFQSVAGAVGTSITATTGTIVFLFKTLNATLTRPALVTLQIAHHSGNNVNNPVNHPAAIYSFRLFNTTAGVCSIGGEATIMEYQYVRATHFAFADLGSGECTITLTNPRNVALLTQQYSVQILGGGLWHLDSVTTT
jgi:hypothetical protein